MKQTYEQFADAMIDGINEESGLNTDESSKNLIAEKLADLEKKMTEKIDNITKGINSKPADDIDNSHTDDDNDTDDNDADDNDADDNDDNNE